jgi:hypothetical protein
VVEREKCYRIDDPSVRARSWFAGFAAHLAGIEESLSATILVCERGAWRVWDPTPPGP